MDYACIRLHELKFMRFDNKQSREWGKIIPVDSPWMCKTWLVEECILELSSSISLSLLIRRYSSMQMCSGLNQVEKQH